MSDKMSRKGGLGRGLSALMADVQPEPSPESGAAFSEQSLPIEKLEANPDQPRRDFRGDELTSLANSIREKGIIQPHAINQVQDL